MSSWSRAGAGRACIATTPPARPHTAALAALADDADVVLALGFDDHAPLRLTVEPCAGGEPGPALKVLAEDGRQPAFRLDKREAIADLVERLSEESIWK